MATRSSLSVEQYRVGVVCALPDELSAAIATLDERHKPIVGQDKLDLNNYVLGRVHEHNVVIACLPAGIYGTVSAARVANDMLRTFTGLRFGLMVGIGGGIPNLRKGLDIRLGDVVISQPDKTYGGVLQYDLRKNLGEGQFERKGFLKPPPTMLLTALATLRADHNLDDSDVPRILADTMRKHRNLVKNGYGFPGRGSDTLYCPRCGGSRSGSSNSCNFCVDGRIERPAREDDYPSFWYGTIASGNELMKNAAERDRIGEEFGALCVEMEAAGLMNDFPCLVIRGICDYADSNKNDVWQKYAALTAAAYTKEFLGYISPEQTSREMPVQKFVDALDKQFRLMGEHLHEVKRENKEQEQRYQRNQARKCHQAFKTSTYEQFKDGNPDRVEGTCRWVLSHPQYLQWATSDEDNLLWISADPGCGKSVLAKSLIDNELRTTNKHTVCYFFFKDNEQQDKLTTALCALLHQLFSHRLQLVQYAIPAWEKTGDNVVKEVPELWRTFLAAATGHEAHDVTCVFDALDECRLPDRRWLIDILAGFCARVLSSSSTTRRGRLKILVTSRPYFEIVRGFPDNARHRRSFHIAAEKENASVSSDVQLYIRQRLSVSRLSPKQICVAEEKLKLAHQQNFLCAFLLTESLFEQPLRTTKQLLAVLDQLPKSMEEQYERILSRCKKRRKAMEVLSLIVAARRPLTLEEIDVILSFQRNGRSCHDLDLQGCDGVSETVRDTCGLFVRVVDGKIYLLHETAREFLLRRVQLGSNRYGKGSWKSSIGLATSHTNLALTCVIFMKMRNRPRLAPSSAFLDYANQNWGYHVIEAWRLVRETRQGQYIQKMIGWGLDLQLVDADGRSLLHQTLDVAEINLEHVCLVLSHGGLVQSADRENMTCMHYASLRGEHGVIRILVEAGFNVNARVIRSNPTGFESASAGSKVQRNSVSNLGLTALHAAAFFGKPDNLRSLLDEGAEVNAQNETGRTALHLTLVLSLGGRRLYDIWDDPVYMVGHIWDYEDEKDVEKTNSLAHEARQSILHILCDHPDIDVSIKDNYGRTALHMVRYKRDGSEVHATQHLLKHGADRLAQDDDGATPLHLAARAGDLLSLKVLVESPGDVMIEDARGCNLLLYAARSGFGDVVQFLADTCADRSIHLSADRLGRNALHHCFYDEKDFIPGPTPELVRILLEAGVSANHQDHDGLDTLAWYTSNLFTNANAEIMELLITHGADLNYKDQNGRNLAHLVMQCDFEFDLGVLLMLLKYGVDALSVDHDGRGILHHAAISGSVTVELLSYLSESLHLNIASLDAFGKSALGCAKERRREIAEKPWGPDIFRGDRWRDTEAAFLRHARDYRKIFQHET